MKKDDVKVGGTYTAKVTDKVVPVRIDAVKGTGWTATNLATGRKVRIKSAQRLHGEAKASVKQAGDAKGSRDGKQVAGAKLAGDGGQTAGATRPGDAKLPVGAKPGNDIKQPAAPKCPPDDKPSAAPNKPATPPTAATDAKAPAAAATEAKPTTPATPAKQGGQTPDKADKPSNASKTKKATKANAAKRPSGLDAAARVLAESKEPMAVRDIVKLAFAKGYWKSDGQTPHATIYSALHRDVAAKGKESRFKKVGRRRFAVNE
jgi:hypothetical protein